MKTEQLLEKLTKKTLIDFVVEYAQNDSRFANAINVHFGAPEHKTELAKMERQIDIALGDVSDYHARDRWGYYHVDLSDIINEVYQRAEQNHIRLAFAETELAEEFKLKYKRKPLLWMN